MKRWWEWVFNTSPPSKLCHDYFSCRIMTLSGSQKDPLTHSAASDLDELQTHISVLNPAKVGPTGPSHTLDAMKSNRCDTLWEICWCYRMQMLQWWKLILHAGRVFSTLHKYWAAYIDTSAAACRVESGV